MKSGLLKKLLAVGMIAILLAMDVTPVLAQEVSGSETEEIDTEEESSEEESSEEESSEEESSEEESGEEESSEEESSEEESSEEESGEEESGEEDTVSGNDTSVSENAIMLLSEPYEGEVAVTINHYLYDEDASEYTEEDMLFTPEELTVENGESIAQFVKGDDLFEVTSITVDGVDVTDSYADGQLPLEAMAAEAEVAVYYAETTGTFENDVLTIDYNNGRASNPNSINYDGNYDSTIPWNQRMATKGAAADYYLAMTVDGHVFNANEYLREEFQPDDYPIIHGLLEGLSGENYENVDFTYADPGFFTSEVKNGKTFMEGYSLKFNRSGATYDLSKVLKDGKELSTPLRINFFPLDQETGYRNEYFGMRYDFSFQVGDYIGDMVYRFNGDDDMWVCMNGEVILDLGGIHGTYPGNPEDNNYKAKDYAPSSVDIWNVLLGDDYTVQDKIDYAQANADKEHTITVLYMERGGSESTCEMSFVMPNVTAKEPVVSITIGAELEILKVDAKDQTPVADVEFTLTDANGEGYALKTDANGYLKFSNLVEGTYTLEETSSPGYHGAGPWTINVTKTIEDDGAKTVHSIASVVETASNTKMEAADGVYTIENTKIELTQDKNAEVANWDNRIYKITLETSLKEYEGRTSTEGVTVTDYIDSRFALTDAQGNALATGAQIADAAGNMGVVKKDANGQYVEWSNITVTTEGWSAVIYVKAKDYFIGGNMIPTNAAGSQVTAGTVVMEFDKPTVNVKLLDLSLENSEITLFKGEQITPGTYMDELSDTLAVLNIENEEVALSGGLPELSEDDTTALIQNKSITKDYSFVSEAMGTFTYELVDDQDDDQWENHEAVKVGEKVEDYTLKVTYTAKSLEDRAKVMSGYETPEENDGEEVTSVETTVAADETGEGNYFVNVIAGSLLIKKTIDLSDADFKGGDPIFTFKVMKDGEFHSYHTVRYTEGGSNVKTVAVKELGKGVYTIEECKTMRYELDGVTAQGVGNCPADASADDTKATFGIGRSIEEEATALNARDGEVAFENEKNNSRSFSDTDVVKNSFVIGEDGMISWSGDSLGNSGNDRLDESEPVEERTEDNASAQLGTKGKLQSYNYQTHFVSATAGSSVSVTVNASSEWRMVQGLASDGSEYVSFESVQYPGYYLRHSGFKFYLEENDGTDGFKADATFKKVEGLADSDWTSFESYNYAGRYIRHKGFVLYLEAVSDSEKADATFLITN